MSFYPKLIGAVCGVCAAGALIYAGVSALDKAGVSADGILSSKPTLTVWYTEEKLEDYLSAMALEYQDATGVRVVPVLKSGLEYLEAVNDASIAEESMPDVYLISNDGLESVPCRAGGKCEGSECCPEYRKFPADCTGRCDLSGTCGCLSAVF